MKIWIMRHGEASFDAPRDSLRHLTANGRAMARLQGEKLASQFKVKNIQLDKIIVSPYLRAKQTFEEVMAGMQAAGFEQSFANLTEEWDGITPAGNVDTVMDYLAFLQEEGAKNVLIISHLPLVFDLTSALTQHQAKVHFYPAVVAEVEMEMKGECGVLVDVLN